MSHKFFYNHKIKIKQSIVEKPLNNKKKTPALFICNTRPYKSSRKIRFLLVGISTNTKLVIQLEETALMRQ